LAEYGLVSDPELMDVQNTVASDVTMGDM